MLRTAGHDETLPTLTGVQMTLEGETLAMAATDRYRFAVAEVPATATVQPLEKPLTALIPAGILAPLAKRLKSYEGLVCIGIIENGEGLTARATLSTVLTEARHGRPGLPASADARPDRPDTHASELLRVYHPHPGVHFGDVILTGPTDPRTDTVRGLTEDQALTLLDLYLLWLNVRVPGARRH